MSARRWLILGAILAGLLFSAGVSVLARFGLMEDGGIECPAEWPCPR